MLDGKSVRTDQLKGNMKLKKLTEKLNARIVSAPHNEEVEIKNFYAGDKISELLNEACSSTVVVSNVINHHIIRVAEILDIPAICLTDNFTPDEEMTKCAHEVGVSLLVSPAEKKEVVEALTFFFDQERRNHT